MRFETECKESSKIEINDLFSQKNYQYAGFDFDNDYYSFQMPL